MKNYPEYPDDEDVAIKDLALSCGIDDFQKAKAVVDDCKSLQKWAICHRKLVRAAIRLYLGKFLPR